MSRTSSNDRIMIGIGKFCSGRNAEGQALVRDSCSNGPLDRMDVLGDADADEETPVADDDDDPYCCC